MRERRGYSLKWTRRLLMMLCMMAWRVNGWQIIKKMTYCLDILTSELHDSRHRLFAIDISAVLFESMFQPHVSDLYKKYTGFLAYFWAALPVMARPEIVWSRLLRSSRWEWLLISFVKTTYKNIWSDTEREDDLLRELHWNDEQLCRFQGEGRRRTLYISGLG